MDFRKGLNILENKLKSITKSTYIDEGMKVLEVLKENKFNTYKELQENHDINQNSEHSRKTCWGQIKKRYLDLEKGDLINSPFLKLFNNNLILKKELMYLKYIYAEPTFKFLIINYLYPRLESSGEFILTRNNVIDFLQQYLDYSEATINKTARSSVKALMDFGIAEKKEDSSIKIKYYQPELKSFLYAFYNEYSKENSSHNKYNILNPSVEHIIGKSDFYKYLFVKPAFVNSYLQSGWKEGFLGYEPRGGLNQYVLKHNNIMGLANYIENK